MHTQEDELDAEAFARAAWAAARLGAEVAATPGAAHAAAEAGHSETDWPALEEPEQLAISPAERAAEVEARRQREWLFRRHRPERAGWRRD